MQTKKKILTLAQDEPWAETKLQVEYIVVCCEIEMIWMLIHMLLIWYTTINIKANTKKEQREYRGK